MPGRENSTTTCSTSAPLSVGRSPRSTGESTAWFSEVFFTPIRACPHQNSLLWEGSPECRALARNSFYDGIPFIMVPATALTTQMEGTDGVFGAEGGIRLNHFDNKLMAHDFRP